MTSLISYDVKKQKFDIKIRTGNDIFTSLINCDVKKQNFDVINKDKAKSLTRNIKLNFVLVLKIKIIF